MVAKKIFQRFPFRDSYVDKGILIDTYYCVSDDVITVIPTFKNTNYNCPSE